MLRRNSKETVRTQNRGVRTRIFWRLRPQHSVRIVAQQIPGLSMSWKFYKHNSGPFQEAWEPRYCTAVAYAATGGSHALTGTCPLNHRLGMSTNPGSSSPPDPTAVTRLRSEAPSNISSSLQLCTAYSNLTINAEKHQKFRVHLSIVLDLLAPDPLPRLRP